MARAKKAQKTYVAGTKFFTWSLLKEREQFVIRRWVEYPTGKREFERLP